jgi:hypothetical protein
MNPLLPAVHGLIRDRLTDDDFLDLCQQYFPAVDRQFTTGQTRGQRIRLLLDYVQTRRDLSALLAAVKAIRPDVVAAATWEVAVGSAPPPAEAAGPPECPPPCDVLLLAANPRRTPPLKLREEAVAVREALKGGKDRPGWRVCWIGAARAEQLTGLLRDGDPRILQFSGHGNESGELLFEAADGFEQPVPLAALAQGIAARKGRLECVFFNACFSIVHADALKPYVPYIVGMDRAVNDGLSLRFAKIFYEALAVSQGYRKAFEVARADAEILKLGTTKAPRLIARDAV